MGIASEQTIYGYVGANPLRYSDPFGLKPNKACVNTCIAVGALGGGLLGRLAGGVLGGAAGAAGGTIVAPGVGTVGVGAAGAAAGGVAGGRIGAGLGGTAGGIFGNAACSDDDDFCYNRWEEEDTRCSQWINLGGRVVAACKERAAYRRGLCIGNGGKPNPSEPPEYNPFVDYPR